MPDIRGVDVASFQGEPTKWSQLPQAQGIDWAAVKFTELKPDGTRYVNPDAKADWDYLWWQEHHNGHPMGRVAYLYAHPSTGVKATVALFKSVTDQLGLLDTDGIAYDLEVTDGLSPAQVSSWARELELELASTFGRRPILYTFENFIQVGNCDGLTGSLLWIASITTPGLPRVPHPFRDWFAQQYTIDGAIDQDVAHFSTLSAMRAAMGRPVFRLVEAVWVTAGMDSLVELSHVIQCEIPAILELTLKASPNGTFSAGLREYLLTGDLNAKMPRGITLRYTKQERA